MTVYRLPLWHYTTRPGVAGYALDTEAEATVLRRLNTLDEKEAWAVLQACCGSSAWVDGMMARRQFPSVRALFSAADQVWWSLGEKDFLAAFAAHPRIGQTKKAEPQSEKCAEWSRGEQRSVAQADAGIQAEEVETAAAEQAKLTRVRLEIARAPGRTSRYSARCRSRCRSPGRVASPHHRAGGPGGTRDAHLGGGGPGDCVVSQLPEPSWVLVEG